MKKGYKWVTKGDLSSPFAMDEAKVTYKPGRFVGSRRGMGPLTVFTNDEYYYPELELWECDYIPSRIPLMYDGVNAERPFLKGTELAFRVRLLKRIR